jgi:hypothetical protein
MGHGTSGPGMCSPDEPGFSNIRHIRLLPGNKTHSLGSLYKLPSLHDGFPGRFWNIFWMLPYFIYPHFALQLNM